MTLTNAGAALLLRFSLRTDFRSLVRSSYEKVLGVLIRIARYHGEWHNKLEYALLQELLLRNRCGALFYTQVASHNTLTPIFLRIRELLFDLSWFRAGGMFKTNKY